MEAPEKVYRTTTYLDSDRGKTVWKNKPVPGAENVEYTRTDAFFKKLEEWLDEYISDLANVDTRILVGSFKNYMEGKLDYGR